MSLIELFARRARWQQSALVFCAGALLSFIANLTFSIWATTRRGSNIENGVGMLAEVTSCTAAKNINTAIHVVINVLSTVLLAGSNYCMQCLTAPTREQIDGAHRRSRWVDVGVPSLRNLFTVVSTGNMMLWLLLCFSSLPLHLFYNSAIFTSISVNEYDISVVNEAYMTLKKYEWLPSYLEDDSKVEAMRTAALAGRLDHLDRAACLDAYSVDFQSTRGDLLIVMSNTSGPAALPMGSLHHQGTYALENFGCGIRQAYQWMCSGLSDASFACSMDCADYIAGFRADLDSWAPFGYGVKECYSLPTEERCRLLFSPTLCWLVTALNLLKGVLMLVTALRRDSKPILTVGDAVASFMAVPDEHTVDMCLASKRDIAGNHGLWSRVPRRMARRRHHKFVAASPCRWVTCLLMFLLALGLCAFLYSYGVQHIGGKQDLSNDPSALMHLGLGTLNSKTLIQDGDGSLGLQGWAGLLNNVMRANIPQAIMSLLYFTYNGLFTSIALATEWDGYARHRKGLRVSSPPAGDQRSEYFLQLPYRYSIPLLVVSGLMHWLISQSIFLVFIEVYRTSLDSGGAVAVGPPTYDWATDGWSPAGVVAVMTVGSAMVVFLLASGVRRLGSGVMPVAGSCSAAIAAACHLAPYDETAHVEPLQWGVTSHSLDADDDKKGHCSFSNAEVDAPQDGALYS